MWKAQLSFRSDLPDESYTAPDAKGNFWVAGGSLSEPYDARFHAWRQYRDTKSLKEPGRTDDLHAYLPNYRRVRRVSAADVEGVYMPSFSVGVVQANTISGIGGGFGGGAAGSAGPVVLPGVYNVALVVDGKTIETRPLRVMDDPEVALTAVERKKLFDMAMEMQELQKRGADVANLLTPLNAKVTELASQVSSSTSVPADVKTPFDQLSKDLAAMMPKFVQQGVGRGGAGGGGGGRGGAAGDNVMAQAAQAKNGLMGGMWPTEQTMKAYSEAKTKMPKAIADANALIARAQTLSTQLANYNVTLTVPQAAK
jgi:hypothetical protein